MNPPTRVSTAVIVSDPEVRDYLSLLSYVIALNTASGNRAYNIDKFHWQAVFEQAELLFIPRHLSDLKHELLENHGETW